MGETTITWKEGDHVRTRHSLYEYEIFKLFKNNVWLRRIGSNEIFRNIDYGEIY